MTSSVGRWLSGLVRAGSALVTVALLSGCGNRQDNEVALDVQPSEIACGATVQLILTTESDMGSGAPSVSIVPTDGLQLGQPIKQDNTAVRLDVHANDDAALGTRLISVTTNKFEAKGKVAIVEAQPEAATFSCQPSLLKQGESETVDVLGTNTHFVDGESQIALVDPQGVSVSNLVVTGETEAQFDIVVDADAPVGPRELTITTGDEVATGTLVIDFAESVTPPTIEVEPENVKAGTEELLIVKGEDVHFSSATTVTFDPAASIEVLGVVFHLEDDIQTLDVHVSVAADAATGVRDLVVTSPVGEDDEVVSTEILITPPATMIADPDSGWQGDQDLEVSFIGSNTAFGDNTDLLAESGTGVHIQYYTVENAVLLTATIDIDQDATPGDVVFTASSPITDGFEVVTATFTVNEVVLVPSIEITPASGMAGDSLELTIAGTNTNFEDSVTTLEVTAGTGLTIDSFTVDSPTQITVQVTLAPDAITNEVTLTVTTGDEVASDTFQVLEYVETCADFDVVPGELSVGSYSASFYLQGVDTDWVFGETVVELVDAPEHIILESCSVSTPTHISCMITVGLLAVPGEHELHATTGDQTLCGLLAINGESITDVTAPADILPEYNTYTGFIDAPDGNPFEIFHLNAEAGDTLVFHAFSLDRVTLDPVLRLIDSTGDDWLVYKDDETPMGIDSRIVYHFAGATDIYIEVGPKLPSCYGNFELYVYRLSHGAVVPELAGDNDTIALAQDVTLTPPGDAVPYVIYGALTDINDVDVYKITVDTEVAIDVVARRLGPWTGSTADLILTVFDITEIEVASNATWYEIPTSADPRVFLDTPGTYYLAVESQEDSWGFYGIDVRHRLVINEVDNRLTTVDPFVELVGPSSFELLNYELCSYGNDGLPVDPDNPCASIAGFTTSSFGYLAIHYDDLLTDTLNLPPGPGAVVLRQLDTTVDQVQYGAIDLDPFAEGLHADVGDSRVIGRGAEVDTNHNWLDFIYLADPSPGQANDRALKAAVPLFGEEEG